MKKIAGILLLMLVTFQMSFAGSAKWRGTFSNDWNNILNWDSNPSGKDVEIDPTNLNGSAQMPVISSNSTFTVKKMYINNGALLTIQADLTVTNVLDVNFAGYDPTTMVNMTGGTLTLSGSKDLWVEEGGTFSISGGTINVNHYIQVYKSGQFYVSGTATVNTKRMVINEKAGAGGDPLLNISGGLVHITETAIGQYALLLDGDNKSGYSPKLIVTGGSLIVEGETWFDESNKDRIELNLLGGNSTFKGTVINAGAPLFINITSGTTRFQGDLMMLGTNDSLVMTGGTMIFEDGATWTNLGQSAINGGTIVVNDYTPLYSSGIFQFHHMIINPGGTLDQIGPSEIRVSGNWLNSGGTFDPRNKTVCFNGSSLQNVDNHGGEYSAVKIDNLGAGVTLIDPMTMNGLLTLSNGNLNTDPTNMLILNDGATATAGNNNSYVNGPMMKIGNNAFAFPVGDNGYVARIGISAPIDPTTAFVAEYHFQPYSSLDTDPDLTGVSKFEYWDLSRPVGTDPVRVSLYWEDGIRSGITDLSDVVVAHYEGSLWEDLSQNGGVFGSAASGYVTSDIQPTFSPFTFGSMNGNNPLPLGLNDFTAQIVGSNVELEWTAAGEHELSGFDILRSSNGEDFEMISFVDPNKSSSVYSAYGTIDIDPLKGVSYYKVAVHDLNGEVYYSNMAEVKFTEALNLEVTLSPNPVSSDHNLNIHIQKLSGSNMVVISIIDLTGKTHYTEGFEPDAMGNLDVNINQNSILVPGIYIISAQSGQDKISRKVIVK